MPDELKIPLILRLPTLVVLLLFALPMGAVSFFVNSFFSNNSAPIEILYALGIVPAFWLMWSEAALRMYGKVVDRCEKISKIYHIGRFFLLCSLTFFFVTILLSFFLFLELENSPILEELFIWLLFATIVIILVMLFFVSRIIANYYFGDGVTGFHTAIDFLLVVFLFWGQPIIKKQIVVGLSR